MLVMALLPFRLCMLVMAVLPFRLCMLVMAVLPFRLCMLLMAVLPLRLCMLVMAVPCPSGSIMLSRHTKNCCCTFGKWPVPARRT